MALKRMTAKKVKISNIINGQWVKKEGMEPSFVKSQSGNEIARARIMGTVVSKFVAEDGNFASITVDDSTETIRAKTFKSVKPLDTVEIGDLVDLVGKTREYNGEIYIIPEIVTKVTDPNLELLRKLEVGKVVRGKPVDSVSEEEPEKSDDSEDLRKEILKMVEESGTGISFTQLIKKSSAPEEQAESIINELLAEGICYEPTPGKIRKI
jgi:RPA family protein